MKFDFKEKYILENEIVRLQPLENTDFKMLLEYSENEPEIWEFNLLQTCKYILGRFLCIKFLFVWSCKL